MPDTSMAKNVIIRLLHSYVIIFDCPIGISEKNFYTNFSTYII